MLKLQSCQRKSRKYAEYLESDATQCLVNAVIAEVDFSVGTYVSDFPTNRELRSAFVMATAFFPAKP